MTEEPAAAAAKRRVAMTLWDLWMGRIQRRRALVMQTQPVKRRLRRRRRIWQVVEGEEGQGQREAEGGRGGGGKR